MKKKKMPHFKTDEELEAFLEQDLSSYLHKGNFSDIKFVFEPKSEKLNMRMTPSLMKTLKQRAKKLKIPYQKYVHSVLEHAMVSKETM
jgi:predicted DNA binding CopG/RHH family protein